NLARGMSQKLVGICGSVATGKTTLAQALADAQSWPCAFEPVDENPYLKDFYGDMSAWALRLQFYFLGMRAVQHAKASANPTCTVLDRTVYEDGHVFARALHSQGHIADQDFLTYWRVFEIVTAALRPPDLFIYLRAPTSVLLERIRHRGR